MAQWVKSQPENLRVAGSITSQGICLGCRPDPQLGACKRQPTDGFLFCCFFFKGIKRNEIHLHERFPTWSTAFPVVCQHVCKWHCTCFYTNILHDWSIICIREIDAWQIAQMDIMRYAPWLSIRHSSHIFLRWDNTSSLSMWLPNVANLMWPLAICLIWITDWISHTTHEYLSIPSTDLFTLWKSKHMTLKISILPHACMNE